MSNEEQIPDNWNQRIQIEPKILLNEIRSIITSPDFSKKTEQYKLNVLFFHCKLLAFHISEDSYEVMKKPNETNCYCPRNKTEEILLTLNLIEVIVGKDVSKLAKTPYFVFSIIAYQHAHLETLLIRMYERMISAMSGEYDRWLSFAYTMINSKYDSHSLPIISHITSRPSPPPISKTLLYHTLLNTQQSSQLINSKVPSFYQGIAHSQLSVLRNSSNHQQQAIQLLLPLIETSPIARFHISLLYADIRQPLIALKVLLPLLKVPMPALNVYKLTVLLLISLKKIETANSTLSVAIRKYPNDLFLRVCQLRIKPDLDMLVDLFKRFNEQAETHECDVAPSIFPSVGSDVLSSTRSSARSTAGDQASRVSSLAFAQSKLTFTERVSVYSIFGRNVPAALWKEAVLVFNAFNMKEDIKKCIQEGEKVACLEDSNDLDRRIGLEPVLPSEFHMMRAVLCGETIQIDELQKAKIEGSCDAAFALVKEKNKENLNNNDKECLIIEIQSYLKQKPFDHNAWELMGNLYEQLGNENKACDCFELAIKLKDTEPLLPFSCIERTAILN
ncbi:hypothetical protein ENUP19_0082G0043 [Entamoeba nuttalli]|uniref:Tetratricopeptide repeat-containing protein n=2 Tax=Entamoeba nuttalli TaxID=412467 RepID=K2GY19_ENTNP|nr:tetratricopeptide repeat-containing protein [Entamoeba nuttalli P19]EKE38677.1 tetratricopeptide repeat-containing protein [Entamoeba nuttalli P19]|eukprot:XP_008858991.1 tetratricopeptide repeat-containing protein [Entamoeba nuttalli P19]